jgi:hypothetical protein
VLDPTLGYGLMCEYGAAAAVAAVGGLCCRGETWALPQVIRRDGRAIGFDRGFLDPIFAAAVLGAIGAGNVWLLTLPDDVAGPRGMIAAFVGFAVGAGGEAFMAGIKTFVLKRFGIAPEQP